MKKIINLAQRLPQKKTHMKRMNMLCQINTQTLFTSYPLAVLTCYYLISTPLKIIPIKIQLPLPTT